MRVTVVHNIHRLMWLYMFACMRTHSMTHTNMLLGLGLSEQAMG